MNEGELQEEDPRPPAPFLAGGRGCEVLSDCGAVLIDDEAEVDELPREAAQELWSNEYLVGVRRGCPAGC